jgi:peptidyl-prolyl cis-trans isomerase C
LETLRADFNTCFRSSKSLSKESQTLNSGLHAFRTAVPEIRVAVLRRIFLFFLQAMILCCGPSVSHGEDPSKIVAEVNNAPITAGEVENEITRIISGALYHKDFSPEKREKFRKQAIESLIDKTLAYQEAERRGIKADRKKVEATLAEVKKKFPSEKAFHDALKKNNVTLEKYEERIGRDFVTEEIFRSEVDDKAKVGEDQVREYYENNKSTYKELEQIKLSHIMVMFDPSEGKEDRDRARKKAEEILSRAKAGEDFNALGSETSGDVYKVKAGELDYIHRGRMDPEIEDSAFALKVGEVMGPVETEYGYYIIRLDNRKPENQRSFDEVKGEIRTMLEKKAREERKTAWITSLKEKAKIEYR